MHVGGVSRRSRRSHGEGRMVMSAQSLARPGGRRRRRHPANLTDILELDDYQVETRQAPSAEALVT